MALVRSGFSLAILSCATLVSVDASGFLVTGPRRASSIRNGTAASRRSFNAGLGDAMDGALGCGSQVGHEELSKIEEKLQVMWRTLPKNEEGNVERRSLRYAVHRYFNREWSMSIRGFEPTQPLNVSGWGTDDILAQRVPSYVESVLESAHKSVSGFTLRDTATMVATIEQLISDAELALLQETYEARGKSMKLSLNTRRLTALLEYYLVRWLLRVDHDTTEQLLAMTPMDIEKHVPHWRQVSNYIKGQVRKVEYERRNQPVLAFKDGVSRPGHNALQSDYSFEDAHRIVGSITKSFASFWESECASMKVALYNMDTHRTGRVPLAKFHNRGLEADWRFGESEAYLREMGALDETGWLAKQVIISNYMQSASNCVVSTAHYLVCCKNDCEALLDEIEVALGAPTAKPEELLELTSRMNAQSTLDDDFPQKFEKSLRKQLGQIAAAHGGEVPLHGRLFAQWLHYAFPRECPYPHKAGVINSMTPSEYGEAYYASSEEMRASASEANATDLPAELPKDVLPWMSQWSEEEELIAEHASLRAPWTRVGGFALGGASLLLAGVVGVARISGRKSNKAAFSDALPSVKQHYV